MKNSLSRYDKLFDYYSEGVAIHEMIFDGQDNPVDYRIIEINAAYEKILSLKRKETIGKLASELYGSTDPPYLDLYHNVVAQGNSRSFETFYAPMNMYFDITVVPLDDTSFATIFFDITHRKIIEEQLQSSEAHYRALVDNSADPIYVMQDNKYIAINKSWERLFGYTKEEVVSTDFDYYKQIIARESRDYVTQRIKQRAAGKSVDPFYSFVAKTKDGRLLKIEASVTDITWNGKPAIQGMYHDVTDRETAKAELELSNKLQSVLYNIAAAADDDEDLKTLFQSIHQCLKEIIDVTNFYIAFYDSDKEMISFPYYIDEKDKPPKPHKPLKGLTEYVLSNRKPLFIDKKGISALKRTGAVSVEGTTSELWLGSPLMVKREIIGIVAVQSYRDPTLYNKNDLKILQFVSNQIAKVISRKHEEEKVRRSEEKHRLLSEQLYESNNIKELLLDVITHDLRNPAGVISGMVELLKEEIEDNEMLDYIRESSNTILDVITNATTLSKLSIGEKIVIDEIDIIPIIKQIVNESSALLQSNNLELEMKLPEKLFVRANPIIKEVVRNYLINAMKYGNTGKKITIEAKRGKSSTKLFVDDYGESLSKDDFDRIFDRGFRLSKKTVRGSGLGLAIVKRIAEAHSGSARGEPLKPVGNRFIIELPINN
jgi:PAS domain S-box-containing protein